MALLPSVFKPSAIDTSLTVSGGWYLAEIVKSELKSTKTPGGKMLVLHWKIIGEKSNGRMIWQRLNIINKNETAMAIAERQLAEICNAAGLGDEEVEDSTELHKIPMYIMVKETESEQYGPGNDISSVRSEEEHEEKSDD